MSLSFSVTSREVRAGSVICRGTVSFTNNTDPEPVDNTDIDSTMDKLSAIQIEASGNDNFQFIPTDDTSGNIYVIDVTGGSFSRQTGVSVAGLDFVAIGRVTD